MLSIDLLYTLTCYWRFSDKQRLNWIVEKLPVLCKSANLGI